MNPKSIVMFLVVLMAGLLGAAAAYQVALPATSAESAPRESLVISDTQPGDQATPRAAQGKRFAKCRKPAVLDNGTCVTEVVRTVAVPGSSGSSSSGSSGRTPTQSSVQGPRDDDARPDDHGGDDGDDDWDDSDDDSRDDHSDHSDDDSGTSTRTRTGH